MDYKAIKEKDLEELSIDELSYIHLTKYSSFDIKTGYLKSTLPILIQEIRHARHQAYSKNLIPLISAFAIFDQLGSCYKRNDISAYPDTNASGIKKSLYYFCGFGANCNDTKALFALRNSLLHDASLISKAKHANQPNYIFRYNQKQSEYIKHAPVTWDGDFESLDHSSMTTFVNTEKVIDLAESTIDTVLKLLTNGNIEVILPDKEIELFYRYLFHCPYPQA